MELPKNFWNIVRVGVVVLIVLFIAIALKELKSIAYVGTNPNMTNMITVDGTGDAVSVPDIATFSFTVSETAKTVAEAQTKATEKVNSALKAVKDAGVADEDTKTISYNISPRYEYQNGVCTAYNCAPSKSILTGYEVSQGIQVKIRELSKAGAIFTSIGSLDVQNVNGLSFDVDNPDSIKAEARAEAIKNAQDKAKELAKQLNVRLVKVTGFYESSGPIPYAYGMGGDMKEMAVTSAAPRVAPEIPAGEEKVTSTVTITYEIE